MTPAEMAALMARAMPGARGWSEEEFAALVARPGALIAGDHRAFVIGQVLAGEAEIFMVVTDPAHRRAGLARAALAEFTAQAAQRGADRVILEVAEDNAAARALYAALGYRGIGERKAYYSRGDRSPVAAIVLENRL